VLDSSFQRTVFSHSLPKQHVPRIPVFISLHFRATFLPFLHLRHSPQHPTQPTITEISRSPSPNKHTKQSRKYHSLPPQSKKHRNIPPTPPPSDQKNHGNMPISVIFFLGAILGDLFDNRSHLIMPANSIWDLIRGFKG